MKKKVIMGSITAVILIIAVFVVFSVFVGAGENRRTFIEEDVNVTTKSYIEDFKKDVENNKQRVLTEFGTSNTEIDEDALKTDAIELTLMDETEKMLSILKKYGKEGYDVSVPDLYKDKLKFYNFIIDLCEIYKDKSNDLSLEEATAIRTNVLYFGGSIKLNEPVNAMTDLENYEEVSKKWSEARKTAEETFNEQIGEVLYHNTDIVG